VAPPGEAASNINPTANAGSNPNIFATKKQMAGNNTIWHINAIATALGYFMTLLKSSMERAKPKPSIIMPRAIGSNVVDKKFDCIRTA
jgi:hypothetical protein